MKDSHKGTPLREINQWFRNPGFTLALNGLSLSLSLFLSLLNSRDLQTINACWKVLDMPSKAIHSRTPQRASIWENNSTHRAVVVVSFSTLVSTTIDEVG